MKSIKRGAPGPSKLLGCQAAGFKYPAQVQPGDPKTPQMDRARPAHHFRRKIDSSHIDENTKSGLEANKIYGVWGWH